MGLGCMVWKERTKVVPAGLGTLSEDPLREYQRAILGVQYGNLFGEHAKRVRACLP